MMLYRTNITGRRGEESSSSTLAIGDHSSNRKMFDFTCYTVFVNINLVDIKVIFLQKRYKLKIQQRFYVRPSVLCVRLEVGGTCDCKFVTCRRRL